MRLVSQEDFDKATSREPVHIYCDFCDEDFTRLKHHAQKSAKKGSGACYCSKDCCFAAHSLPTRPCLNCGKDTKSKFCSQHCSGVFNRTGSYRLPRFPCKQCGKESTNDLCSSKCRKVFKEEGLVRDWLSRKISGMTSAGAVCKFVRLYLFRTLGRKCTKCGWCEINPTSGKVPVQVEHIDGDFRNCSRENLTILCPNCHSLTPTYMGLNKGRGRDVNGFRRKKGQNSSIALEQSPGTG